MIMKEFNKGDIIYYARISDNTLLECKIRTVADNKDGSKWYVCTDKDKVAHLFSEKCIGDTYFEVRKDALKALKEYKKSGRIKSYE